MRFSPFSLDWSMAFCDRSVRWNPKGAKVVYTAASRSLAVLEVLVQYSVLPRDFAITMISIPESISVLDVPESVLLPGWDRPIPTSATQEYGAEWNTKRTGAVLRVPSAIVPFEKNYVLNVRHPEFSRIIFSPPQPFQFDPRLK
jgi:RES domain-containing protein